MTYYIIACTNSRTQYPVRDFSEVALKRIAAFSLLALVLLFAATTASAQDVKIGVAAIVNPNATGQTPTRARRTLLVGTGVFSQENVITTQPV